MSCKNLQKALIMKLKYLAINVFVLICALTYSASAAENNVSEVSMLNFVSLRYERTGGYAGITSGMAIHSGTLWIDPAARPNQESNKQSSYPLSFNQQIALFRNINAAGITELVGDYRQKNLADGFDETLILTISDAQDQDQQYVIKNYGNTAPRNFYQFIDYLNEVRDHKTGQMNASSQPVNSDNLESLTLNTIGGIAGIQSQVEIHAPDKDSHRQWMIHSNERSRGRTIQRQSNISVNELNALFQALSNANLEEMNGHKYRQQGLMDGFNNTLTVTLQDGKKFTTVSYGNKAPAEFYKIVAEVNRLRQEQLADQK